MATTRDPTLTPRDEYPLQCLRRDEDPRAHDRLLGWVPGFTTSTHRERCTQAVPTRYLRRGRRRTGSIPQIWGVLRPRCTEPAPRDRRGDQEEMERARRWDLGGPLRKEPAYPLEGDGLVRTRPDHRDSRRVRPDRDTDQSGARDSQRDPRLGNRRPLQYPTRCLYPYPRNDRPRCRTPRHPPRPLPPTRRSTPDQHDQRDPATPRG